MPERTTRDASSLSLPLPPPRLWTVLLLYGAAAGYWIYRYQWLFYIWREDLAVYTLAVRTWLAGVNPYGAALAPLYFVYPPFFLYAAGLLSHLIPAGWGDSAYTALHVEATLALPLFLARFYFRQRWLTPAFALLVFIATPLFMGILALCSLNIASTLYCLCFVAGIPGLHRDRWRWFYGAVFLAAMIKITFLALLLLPLLAGRRQVRQWVNCTLCGAVVIGANLLEMRLLPELYTGYRWSLVQAIVHEKYYGFGIFGVVMAYGYKLHLPAPASAYAAAVGLAVVMTGAMLLLRQRLAKQDQTGANVGRNGIWLALVVALLILVNPRQLQYDGDVSLFAAFPLWVYALRIRRPELLVVVLFIPSLLIHFVVKAPPLYGMYGTFETLTAFALAWWRLWHETAPGEAKAQELSA